MPTIEHRPQTGVDPRFVKLLVLVNAGVPLALLAWDAWFDQLGVNGVNYAIRTTGLLGLLFLLLSLTVTPLRRITGFGWLIGSRRTLGLYGFAYIALHFAIFYVFDRAGSVASTVEEIISRQYLLIGTIGLLAMVPLAITSTDAMVLRLGARRWKALHRAAYLAAIAGALHYYLLVKADVRQPLIFAGVLTTLLGARVVDHYLGLRRASARSGAAPRSTAARRKFWSGRLRVAAVFEETPDVRTFRMVNPDGGPIPFDYLPGQYLTLTVDVEGRPVKRSYTIASSPSRPAYCEITIKRKDMGFVSGHLHDTLSSGASIAVAAPGGRFTFTGEEAEHVVLIGGGVGITPLMSIVRSLTDRCWSGRIDLVFAVRTEVDIIFRDELQSLARRFANLHVHLTCSGEVPPSWMGDVGRVSSELLQRRIPDLDRALVYLCGPEPMMWSTTECLLALGVDRRRILTEAFVSPVSSSADSAERESLPLPDVGLVRIRLARSNRIIEVDDGRTVLEAAEDEGVELPYECRSGICGQCKTRLLSGRVVMDAEDALSSRDKAGGLVLTCQARARTDVVLDA